VRIEEDVKEYMDASTGTEDLLLSTSANSTISTVSAPALPEAGPSRMTQHHYARHNGQEHDSSAPLPPYSKDPAPINAEQVLEKAHPREKIRAHHVHEKVHDEADEAYAALSDALGLRCQVLEEELKAYRAEREKRLGMQFVLFASWRNEKLTTIGDTLSPSPSGNSLAEREKQNKKSGKEGIKEYILYSADGWFLIQQLGKFTLYSVLVFSGESLVHTTTSRLSVATDQHACHKLPRWLYL
jgi:hypothetical protein